MVKHIDGGRIEILRPTDEGVFGVWLLPDEGEPAAYRSNDQPKVPGFPMSFNVQELFDFAEKEWERRYPA
jgi:hypothetical protein